MSPRAWRYGLILGAICWGLILGGVFACREATAAPVSDAPTFLARYGLDASAMPPIVFVDDVSGSYGLGTEATTARAYRDRVAIERPQPDNWGSRAFAADVLHEAIHYASFWRYVSTAEGEAFFGPMDLPEIEAWMQCYEEGLDQAATDALMANWWRYLTGKRLERGWRRVMVYEPHVRWWKALAKRATGASWRSRAGRDYLLGALALGPVDRMELARITELAPAPAARPGA